MKKRLMTLLLLCAALVPILAQDEKSHILIYKVDSTIDTLLLNNVRDVYHSRLDADGVEHADIMTLRLRTVSGERVYPLTEIDHLVMPERGRAISFLGTVETDTTVNGPRKTSVEGTFPGTKGDPVVYKWVDGDRIFLETGEKSNTVKMNNGSATGHFSFNVYASDTLVADQYVVFYPGVNDQDVYNKVVIPTTQTQTGADNSKHLGKSGDCGVAIATRNKNSDYTFALGHKTAVLCFLPRVNKLKTLELKHVAVKANHPIAGTYTLAETGVTLDGVGNDSITLLAKDYDKVLPNATSQAESASYMVVAPQTESTTLKVYYRIYDKKHGTDTVAVKNITIPANDGEAIGGGKVYTITALIPNDMFMAAYTDHADWDAIWRQGGSDTGATLYGTVNLEPQGDDGKVGFQWGYNKNLNNETKEADVSFKLSSPVEEQEDGTLLFSKKVLDQVKQRAYYYRAYATDGDKYWFGKVKKFGMEREIINLGTSVAWSSINFGAITEEDQGEYYSWGSKDKPANDDYSRANYPYYSRVGNQDVWQNIGNDISGNPSYDVVTDSWGSCWRMPTKSELEELKNKCTWTWSTRTDEDGNERSGFVVKHKTKADSLMFMPVTGYYDGTAKKNSNYGYYLSATEKENNNSSAYYFYFQNYSYYTTSTEKWKGLAIRPVFESNRTADTEQGKGAPFFIRTDGIIYNSTQTEANFYGTMRGIDEVVNPVQQGFVIGTAEDVTLDDHLNFSLSADITTDDWATNRLNNRNGSYNLPATAEQMASVATGKHYYRAFLTYKDYTTYGEPLEMTPIEVSTDSTNWAYGNLTARLCGTAKGIPAPMVEKTKLGFVVGTRPDITLADDDVVANLVSDSIDNGKFVSVFDNIEMKQYFYRAYIQLENGTVIYNTDEDNAIAANVENHKTKMLGVEMVDLGLPSGLHWANINLGAQDPTVSGSYIRWAETAEERTNNYNNSSTQYSKYEVALGDINGTRDDAAQMNWKSVWRMPTEDDVKELIANTTAKRVTILGKTVLKLTSKINGKYIYLPYNGRKENSSNSNISNGNTQMYYWATTPQSGNNTKAASMYINSDNGTALTAAYYERHKGLGIRPVAIYNETIDTSYLAEMTTDDVDWQAGQSTATLHGYLFGLRFHENTKDQLESGIAYSTTENFDENSADVHYLKPNLGEVEKIYSGAMTLNFDEVQDNTVYYYRTYAKIGDTYYFANERQFGRKWVDLGIKDAKGTPVLWANINMGASSPDDSGDYYAWGETTPNAPYTKANYTYDGDLVNISGSSYDAAHTSAGWGGTWSMPTRDDLQQLIDECEWTEVTLYDKPMFKVTSKTNGNSIYLIKNGYMNNTNLSYDGRNVSIWTGTLNTAEGISNDNAFASNIYGTNHKIDATARYLGYAIRPVLKYNNETEENKKLYVTTNSTNWQVGVTDVTLTGAAMGTEAINAGKAEEDKLAISYGFVVGYQPGTDVLKVGGTILKNVTVDTKASDDTFTGALTYDKDTTYYYRAYVKVADKYYYGEVRRYGLELVDMGKGIKWASINLGAQTSSDYGKRYAWGEKDTKSTFSLGSYTYYDNGYTSIGTNISGKRYDAVKANWTGNWRLPTNGEMEALTNTDEYDWQWTTVDDVAGYKVTCKIEGEAKGNSIFLPAAGYQDMTFYKENGTGLYYWTGMLDNDSKAYILNGNTAGTGISMERYYGLSIRPVINSDSAQDSSGITGNHQQGQSTQTGSDGTGNGNAGTGNTGSTVGD